MHENKNPQMDALDWVDETIPKSQRFDDTYYSKADGMSETRHVYIGANDLYQRWPNLVHCTIAELGFGTGLNFLTSVEDWTTAASPDARLVFVSFEQYPMKPDAMLHALSRWPVLKDTGEKLASLWQEALETGEPTVEIDFTERVKLIVHLGDANERLPKAKFTADAWYLDGFSPAKNPELWSRELMQSVFDHTVGDGTFATYTAAGWVRRSLVACGFEVDLVKGHAGKREMLRGRKRLMISSNQENL